MNDETVELINAAQRMVYSWRHPSMNQMEVLNKDIDRLEAAYRLVIMARQR